MDDAELVKRLRRASEYEPLGHDGWEAADVIERLVEERDEARKWLRFIADDPCMDPDGNREMALRGLIASEPPMPHSPEEG